MKKKIRELRMSIVCSLLLIVFIIMTIIYAMSNQMPQLIGSLMIDVIALGLVLFRYKHVLYDDMMVIYEWKMFAMLPTLIMYSDIKSIEKKSKYHIIINHERISHIYVYNTDNFINIYEEMKQLKNK